MDRTTKWAGALLIGITLGCDKPPPPPPSSTSGDEAADAASTEVEDRRPKTDEIMAGRWQPLQLGNHPLRVQAPATWEVKTGTSTFLRGPTPNGPLPEGEVNIAVSKLPPFPTEMAKSFEEQERRAATRPAAAPTTTAPALDQIITREAGGNRVLEIRQSIPVQGTSMMSWKIVVFVPADQKTVNTYQLSFLGLTAEQYQKDRELLERIVNSLDVDAPSPLAPSPPTTPRGDPFK